MAGTLFFEGVRPKKERFHWQELRGRIHSRQKMSHSLDLPGSWLFNNSSLNHEVVCGVPTLLRDFQCCVPPLCFLYLQLIVAAWGYFRARPYTSALLTKAAE